MQHAISDAAQATTEATKVTAAHATQAARDAAQATRETGQAMKGSGPAATTIYGTPPMTEVHRTGKTGTGIQTDTDAVAERQATDRKTTR